MHKLDDEITTEQSVDEITTAEAVAILGCERRTITRYVRTGEIEPTKKLPGKTGAYLFRRSDVRELAKRRAAEARAKLEDAERRLSEVGS